MNPAPTSDAMNGPSCEREIDRLIGLGPSDDEQDHFKIGDLAREFGVTLRTLRFYENRGLLNPERKGTMRLYTPQDRKQLKLIQLFKVLGFSLTEVKQLIELYHRPGTTRQKMETALRRLKEQEDVLRQQQQEIAASLSSLERALQIVRSKLAAD